MLIGLLGGVSSGKAQVAEYLEKNFGFKTFLMKNWKATYNNEDGMTADEVDEWMLGSSYWKDNWICYPITCKSDFDKLRRRPYFLSICVDAPLLVRYKRYIKKYKEMNSDVADENSKSSDNAPIYIVTPKRMAESLEEFIELDQRYAGDFHAIRFADIVVDNSGSLEQLHKNIESFTPEITSNLRTRLHWDDYFMLLSELAARRSNCMKRRVGCVLTKNNRVLATGYNGTPRGAVNCCDGGCKRCNNGARCGQSLQECLCMHAEENALLEVGRERISDGEATLYCNTCPCLSCAKKIAQCGVKKVVYHKSYGMDDMTKELFLQCGVILQQHTPISHLYLLNE
jgi:dCMP deaminase